MPSPQELSLAFDLQFQDLYQRQGLERIDGHFLAELKSSDPALCERFLAARANPSLPYKEEAELLIAVAPHLDRFVARLFDIEEPWQELFESHHRLAPLFRVKRKFVQRRAMLKVKADEAAQLDGEALEQAVAARLGGHFDELAFAEQYSSGKPTRARMPRSWRSPSASRRGPRIPPRAAGAIATACSSSRRSASIR